MRLFARRRKRFAHGCRGRSNIKVRTAMDCANNSVHFWVARTQSGLRAENLQSFRSDEGGRVQL